jgi:hypothetical protein
LPVEVVARSGNAETLDRVVPVERKRLRPKDIRDQYGVSLTTIYTALYRGELKGQRFQQRVWLIRPEDAEAWIDQCSVPNVA